MRKNIILISTSLILLGVVGFFVFKTNDSGEKN